MNRSTSIIVMVFTMAVIVGVSGVWGFKAIWEQSDFVEVTELTVMPEEIINYTAIRLLKNAHDPLNFSERVGGKLKDYFLVPIYDINGLVVKYWAVGYIGEGEMKSMEEIFAALWYPYNLWEQRERHFKKLQENLENYRNKTISKEEYRAISNRLKEEYKPLSETIYNYRAINYRDYLFASIGAYYEIPPVERSGSNGLLHFLKYYWTCYYHIKKEFLTDDIEFIKFVYNDEYTVNMMFRVGNDYVYARGGSSGIPDAVIAEQNQFVGFDLTKISSDCIFLRNEIDRINLWGTEVIEYFESLEQYGMIEEGIKF